MVHRSDQKEMERTLVLYVTNSRSEMRLKRSISLMVSCSAMACGEMRARMLLAGNGITPDLMKLVIDTFSLDDEGDSATDLHLNG